MTKKVRIENADTSDFKVVVQTWDKTDGEGPDEMFSEQALANPADITEQHITSTRYLVVKEA